jgi:hypothetical protein
MHLTINYRYSVHLQQDFVGGTGVQTQGLALARQALYHLSHTPPPQVLLFFRLLSDRVSLFLPRSAWDLNAPTYTTHVAGTIDVSHLSHPACWDGVSQTFCQV